MPLQGSRTREYVNALEKKVDRLATTKRRLQLKFAKARLVITKIIAGVEKELGLQYLPAAWLVAHMVANLYKPLREPDCMSEWSNAKLQSAYSVLV